MGLDAVRAPLAVAYTDHLLLEADHRNADDHVLLESAARRFGMWYSRAGNGISHAVHQQRFGRPGASLLGADSHTPAAGSLGMLAIGAGGLAVALALAGEPFRVAMAEISTPSNSPHQEGLPLSLCVTICRPGEGSMPPRGPVKSVHGT